MLCDDEFLSDFSILP